MFSVNLRCSNLSIFVVVFIVSAKQNQKETKITVKWARHFCLQSKCFFFLFLLEAKITNTSRNDFFFLFVRISFFFCMSRDDQSVSIVIGRSFYFSSIPQLISRICSETCIANLRAALKLFKRKMRFLCINLIAFNLHQKRNIFSCTWIDMKTCNVKP